MDRYQHDIEATCVTWSKMVAKVWNDLASAINTRGTNLSNLPRCARNAFNELYLNREKSTFWFCVFFFGGEESIWSEITHAFSDSQKKKPHPKKLSECWVRELNLQHSSLIFSTLTHTYSPCRQNNHFYVLHFAALTETPIYTNWKNSNVNHKAYHVFLHFIYAKEKKVRHQESLQNGELDYSTKSKRILVTNANHFVLAQEFNGIDRRSLIASVKQRETFSWFWKNDKDFQFHNISTRRITLYTKETQKGVKTSKKKKSFNSALLTLTESLNTSR